MKAKLVQCTAVQAER